MPCYPYKCECSERFEVVKRVGEIDQVEHCPKCDKIATRTISPTVGFYGAGGWDSSYDPAFGQVVNSASHRKRLAKERNWIEVGNDDPVKRSKEMEKDLSKKLSEGWDNV